VGENVSAAGQDLGHRLSDGALTGIGLLPDTTGRAFIAGGLVTVALLLVAVGTLPNRTQWLGWRVGAASAFALYFVRASQGLGFVPGCIPASPLSAAGVIGADDGRRRAVAAAAVATLPVVWLLSWRGQLIPQWGGRYVLLTGVLLTVVGAVALERAGWRQPAAAVLVGLGLAVAVFSAAWHVDRTRDVAASLAELNRVPSDVVVVSAIAHLGREGGAFYGERRWLTSLTGDDTASAVAVARRAGARRIELVTFDETPGVITFAGWRPAGYRVIDFLGIPLRATRYVR
jgi:hypothetical protein